MFGPEVESHVCSYVVFLRELETELQNIISSANRVLTLISSTKGFSALDWTCWNKN